MFKSLIKIQPNYVISDLGDHPSPCCGATQSFDQIKTMGAQQHLPYPGDTQVDMATKLPPRHTSSCTQSTAFLLYARDYPSRIWDLGEKGCSPQYLSRHGRLTCSSRFAGFVFVSIRLTFETSLAHHAFLSMPFN